MTLMWGGLGVVFDRFLFRPLKKMLSHITGAAWDLCLRSPLRVYGDQSFLHGDLYYPLGKPPQGETSHEPHQPVDRQELSGQLDGKKVLQLEIY